MRHKKILIFAVIILLVITAGFFGYSLLNYEKDYIVMVNGEKASTNEYKFILASIKAKMEETGLKNFDTMIDGKKASEFAKEKALESIVNYKLEVQNAKEHGINLNEEQTKNIVDAAQNIATNNTTLIERLNNSGMNLADYKRMNLNFGMIDMLREQILKEYYEKNKASYVAQEEMVRARHILIKTIDENQSELPAEKVAELKHKAEDILNKAKAGEDFVALVKQFSEDEGSNETGGEYTFKKGDMVSEFESSAYSLKPGEISGLVKTQFGFHIIKLEEKIPVGKQLNFDVVKEKVQEDVQYDKLLEEWKKKSQIVRNDELYNSIR